MQDQDGTYQRDARDRLQRQGIAQNGKHRLPCDEGYDKENVKRERWCADGAAPDRVVRDHRQRQIGQREPGIANAEFGDNEWNASQPKKWIKQGLPWSLRQEAGIGAPNRRDPRRHEYLIQYRKNRIAEQTIDGQPPRPERKCEAGCPGHGENCTGQHEPPRFPCRASKAQSGSRCEDAGHRLETRRDADEQAGDHHGTNPTGCGGGVTPKHCQRRDQSAEYQDRNRDVAKSCPDLRQGRRTGHAQYCRDRDEPGAAWQGIRQDQASDARHDQREQSEWNARQERHQTRPVWHQADR